MPFYFAAMELLKVSTEHNVKHIDGKLCYEFRGETLGGEIFGVHIREEYSGKDRKLYLISTFSEQKKT